MIKIELLYQVVGIISQSHVYFMSVVHVCGLIGDIVCYVPF